MGSTNTLYSEISEEVPLFHKLILIIEKGLAKINSSINTI